MKVLVILNDPAYGSERSYNALRLASALAKRDGVELRGFLMSDAVGTALPTSRPRRATTTSPACSRV